MAQLVLLVVAAAWAAVLIPPMLRSRVENRPNSSVTDFRRQLSKLQSTATPARGSMRTMGRPLAPAALYRPAAAGRPGMAPSSRQGAHRQGAVRSQTATATQRNANPVRSTNRDTGGYRTHGDPSGQVVRPSQADMRSASVVDPRAAVKRRRSNVLLLLVVVTASTLFLASTTGSTAMLYVFALAFLALCGYVYLLAQLRQRETVGAWNDNWFHD